VAPEIKRQWLVAAESVKFTTSSPESLTPVTRMLEPPVILIGWLCNVWAEAGQCGQNTNAAATKFVAIFVFIGIVPFVF
jgi:hypothetical protein